MRIFLFIALALPFGLHGQQGWNFLPDLPFAQPQITDMIVSRDNIIIYGDGFNNPVELRQGLIVAKLDTLGNIIHYNFITDPEGDAITIGEDWGKIIETSDGGYAATAAPFISNSAFLIKFNQDLAVEFIKEYPDTVNRSNFDYKIKEAEGGYLLYGAIQLPDFYSQGFIKYVDYSGDIIWENFFSNTPYGTRILDLEEITDSTFVFVTVEYLEQFPTNGVRAARSGIYKIDLSGNITASWHTGPAPEIGYLRKVIALEDGSIITYGVAQKEIFFSSILVQPTLAKFDTTFTLFSLTNFGPIKSLSADNTIQDFTKTIEGNYVGCGKISIKTGDEPSRGHGWVYKFSPEGDSIWGRHFPTPFPDFYPNGGALYGVGVLSSGSIVAGGTAQDEQNRYCWIVKLTNDGCMDTLFCQQTTSVNEVEGLAEGIKIFPNPASDAVWVSTQTEETIQFISIFGPAGELFLRTSPNRNEHLMDIKALPSGLYWIEIKLAGVLSGNS